VTSLRFELFHGSSVNGFGSSSLLCRSFDVLFVVDPSRKWYDGGDQETFKRWYLGIQQAVAPYDSVVMLGDSMGATAALMFSDLATQVR
jgi:hypothetical protein